MLSSGSGRIWLAGGDDKKGKPGHDSHNRHMDRNISEEERNMPLKLVSQDREGRSGLGTRVDQCPQTPSSPPRILHAKPCWGPRQRGQGSAFPRAC